MSVEVRISRGRHHVVLESPIRAQIPCESLITRVLNKALMILFELGPCGADEGGVEGIIRDEPIELRNLDDQIGLESDHPLEKNPECQKVLDTYERLLRQLFENEVRFVCVRYAPGAILETADLEEAGKILWLAVAFYCSPEITDVIFQRLRLLSPFEGERGR